VILHAVARDDVGDRTAADCEQQRSQRRLWGTPTTRSTAEDWCWPIRTTRDRSYRQERSQGSGFPVTPNDRCRRSNRMVWSLRLCRTPPTDQGRLVQHRDLLVVRRYSFCGKVLPVGVLELTEVGWGKQLRFHACQFKPLENSGNSW